jgi:ADP-ribose pyrophosphatase YjhB (NUDIX family)
VARQDFSPETHPLKRDLLRWSEALAGVARTGLGFTQSLYERERFSEILEIAADMRVVAAGDRVDQTDDPDRQVTEWMASVERGSAGYVTPKTAVGAVVGNDDDEILLIQRADSGVWLYPTGWADVGYSPAEVAQKEVREETGIECEVVGLLAVYDGLRRGFSHIPLYSLVFLCRAVGGELRAHPLECADVGWFGQDALPSPVASYEQWGQQAFAAIRGEAVTVDYDVPRLRTWQVDD